MTAVRHDPAPAPERHGGERARWRWLPPALAVVAFLLIGGQLGGLAGRLSEVQRSDSAAYLPEGGEATRVLASSKRFTGGETTTAIVVFRRPAGAITEADRLDITTVTFRYAEALQTRLASPPAGPIVSDDGRAAQVIVRLVGSDPALIRGEVDFLRRWAAAGTPGLEVHVAGPAAALADLTEVFGAVDGVLLLVTGALVLLILIAVYRSPLLPVLVLAVAGIALTLANATAYLLADAGALTVSGDAQGILGVLVLGAGTDYALLLVSRFREELRRTPDRYRAMRVAWRAAVEPILASGATVILGLLCLLASDLPSTRGLGPVAAIGIACALLAMLVLLPAVLVLCGRAAFWPFRPRPGPTTASDPAGRSGLWSRVAGLVGRRPRLVWTATALALAALAFGMVRLEAQGVPRSESFLAPVDSTAGQEVLTRHFPEAAATPVVIIARADALPRVLAATAAAPGVTAAEAYVDPVERFLRRQAGEPAPGPAVIDGLVRVEATLAMPGDAPEARNLVADLRRTLHALPGADARVGGYTAANLDIQATAQRDRLVVIPLVLGVVLLVLMLLLRAVLAPLVLVGTVLLSFLAALGVSGVVFRDVIGFAGADSSFPLFAFVFLVALGVDYTIFLMSRVREEIDGRPGGPPRGHRAGTLAGLAVTGGVITSAGVVLAATFASLAVLPLVFLAQLAFVVAFGVLLDALVVRSLLVPALTVDIGPRIWWPGRLHRTG